MTEEQNVEVYRIHIWLRQISPMIWRRLLVRDDSTIADLHYTFQIAFGWSDTHLNQFHIHGQDYGVSQPLQSVILSDAIVKLLKAEKINKINR